MEKYEKYKDSGIEWIGEIPEHWEKYRLGIIGKFSSSGIDKKLVDNEPKVKIINYTDIYGNVNSILDSSKDYMIVTTPQSKIDEHSVKKGDLIFTPSSETKEDIGLSALVIEDLENTAFSYHVLRFQFTRIVDLNFKKYICNNYYVLNHFSRNSQGTTRQTLGRNDFKTVEIILPTPEEQTAIANYLDRKTIEIDELIADKKRLLELYEEEKTAIINQAVTKGIMSDVPMKDSGIEWLGEIPEHWETVNFNHYVFLRHGYQFRNFDFTSTGIKVIKITQLKASGELEVNDVSYISEDRLDEFRDIVIVEGDILMALTGGTIGKIIRAPEIEEPLLQNYRVGNFFPKNELITKDFLFWVLSSDLILKQIFYDQRETGQPNIGKEDFGRMFFVLPSSINEQDKIVEFIKPEIKRIDAKKAKTKKLIELLTEYRTALISEVVTGKIKVI